MASDNCAVGSDGNLLDASQIVWFRDPDNDQPIAPTSSSAQRQASASRTMTTMLDSFVTKVPPPVRQSTHAPCLSTKAIDLDNIMALKRKSSNTGAGKPSSCPRYVSPDHEEDKATEHDPMDGEESEDDAAVDPDTAYQETKALGDADREVHAHASSLMFLFDTLQRSCTRSLKGTAHLTSIRFSRGLWTMFIRPEGGSKGHFCVVCR